MNSANFVLSLDGIVLAQDSALIAATMSIVPAFDAVELTGDVPLTVANMSFAPGFEAIEVVEGISLIVAALAIALSLSAVVVSTTAADETDYLRPSASIAVTAPSITFTGEAL